VGAPNFLRVGLGFESLAWHPLDAATINRIPATSACHARAAVHSLLAEDQMTEAAASAVLAATG
jgi:hypothetical protein